MRLSFLGDSLRKIKNPVELIVNDVKRMLFGNKIDFMKNFHHSDGCNHRISMVTKISKIFSVMKLKYDSGCNNAKKNNKFIRSKCTKTILLNSQ